MGRRKIEIDYKILNGIFRVGGTITMACDILDICHDTLERRIKTQHKMKVSEYREKQLSNTKVRLQQKAIDLALNKDNVTMLVFCLKNLCNWNNNEVDPKDLVNEIKLAYNLEDKKG